MQKSDLKYPFDIIKEASVTRKQAKALIVKFLKREGCFNDVITDCMRCHPYLETVDDVLNQLTGTFFLKDCLYLSSVMFRWDSSITHDYGYWLDVRDRWWNAIGDKNIYIKRQ